MKGMSRQGHWPDMGSAVWWIALATLGLGQTLQAAVIAAHHGGWVFVVPLALILLLLALPLRLAEALLGRRASTALLPGMAKLTRECDAPRAYRIWSWGSLLFSWIGVAVAGIINAWCLTYLFHIASSGGAFALDYNAAMVSWGILPAWALSLAVALLLSQHGILHLPSTLRGVGWSVFALLVLAVLLQGRHILELGGSWAALGLASTWWAALELALQWCAGGMGLWYVAAVFLPSSTSLPRLASWVFLVQGLLLLISMMALAGFLPLLAEPRGLLSFLLLDLPNALAGGSVLIAIVLLSSLLLASWVAMVALIEPLRLELESRDWRALSTQGTLLLAIILATALLLLPWPMHRPLQVAMILLMMVLAVFTGWVMKISHARKGLALSPEGLYNAWRIAVRILAPLSLLALLLHLWRGGA